MLNKVILMGRLTRDPELRHTPSNIPVASFSIAVDRNYKSKQEGAQNTDFFDIVAWRNNAEFVAKWFTKGRQIAVVGSLQTRQWQDKDGNNRRTVEVVADEFFFADSKRSGDDSGGGSEGRFSDFSSQPERSQVPSSDYSSLAEDDDELPF
ncbi:single-stranded DNA-binding protein [Oscillospiraceae bacterium OttesenSCG-928-G22]|nr:single-stranded DNA-binding protein [Oscillospiraceae bacterium OttesenSCG-928-G22]